MTSSHDTAHAPSSTHESTSASNVAGASAAERGSHLAQANASAASFAALMSRIEYLDAADTEQLRRAYRFADEAHLGQTRKNGEPYITHPIAVAAECATWKLDAQALMAALLHDTIEDCGIEKREIVERFGPAVAELVDGLTKLEKLQFNTREENQAESFRKMLLAMARDVRVILIKLADRTHNMRTLGDVPREKWGRTAKETLDIYAPIAHRLGLNHTYRELQALAFEHSNPWRHAVLSKALKRARSRRGDLVETVRKEVGLAFAQLNLPVEMHGREKSLFSIYRKMREKHLSFSQVTDIYGFRLVVPSLIDCYTALGALHQLYKPVPGRFKDHIAISKVNGYQSLHTTLVGPRGVNVEFQMRTESMHLVAETGVAAHWLYKARGTKLDQNNVLGTRWLQSLLDIQSETRDAAEFWDHIKIDLFPDAVYVFTPKSAIMALPRGATLLDFAYEIHSDVGDRCAGGKVNGNTVTRRTELRNGDVVEVQTDPQVVPSPAWLSWVRTGRARSKIRHYLKTMAQTESQDLGMRMFEQALRAEGFAAMPPEDEGHRASWDRLLRFTGNRTPAELLTDIGLGKRIASIVAKRMVTLLAENGERPDPIVLSQGHFGSAEGHMPTDLVLDGSEAATVTYGACCHPLPGDPIDGYLGRGEGLTVHRKTCHTGQKLRGRDAERFIDVSWCDQPARSFNANVEVTLTNARGVLARVAEVVAKSDADIVHVDMGSEAIGAATHMRLLIGVRDADHLESTLKSLRRTPSVLGALRL